MQIDSVDAMSGAQAHSQLRQRIGSGRLRALGLVMLCLVAVIGVFHQTFIETVHVWGQSQTYSHGYLVLPIFVYLVWLVSGELARTPIRPFPAAAAAALGVGFLWLLGQLASAHAVSAFAMIAMIPLTVLTVLGVRWARILAFPLVILFFAVPVGEVFVPTLMQWTADFTVAALRLSGVPVYREGYSFVIPSGSWSVVEACSGVRYLMASLFVGALYAWQMYRSPRRRALFLVASIAVPIAANWLRAYLIVMLGHLSENRIAAGVDHLIYGWFFFGIVMFLMFAVGAIWREGDFGTDARDRSERAEVAGRSGPTARVAPAAVLMLLALLAAPTAAAILMRPLPDRTLPNARFAPTAGWTLIEAPITAWRPQLQSPTSEQQFAFEKHGQKVGVFIGFFRNQRQGSELVSSANQFTDPDEKLWQRLEFGPRDIVLRDRTLEVHAETLRTTLGTIVAWRWYWLDGTATAGDFRAKFLLAFDRLLRRDDTSAWIAVFVVDPENQAAADRTLATFVGEMGGALEQGLLEVVGE
jgi:exosortase A